MRGILPLLAFFIGGSIAAQTCPQGCIPNTPPTCEQRQARAKAAHCDLCADCNTNQAYQNGFAEARRTNAKNCPQGMDPAECSKLTDQFYKAGLAAGRTEAAQQNCANCPTAPFPWGYPKEKVRPLLGFGIGYDEYHYVIGHVFGGVQFPKNSAGHNWQIQAGPTYSHRDAIVTTPGSPGTGGTHGQPPIPPTYTVVDPPNWGVTISGVVVF